jgi:hypothetical protein
MIRYLFKATVMTSILLLSMLFPLSYAEYPASSPVVDEPTKSEASADTAAVDAAQSKGSADKSTVTTDAKPAQTADAASSGQTLVARVVWVKGTIKASLAGSDASRILKTASNIYLHDTLVSSPDSEVQIVFTDNSTMTLRPETTFYINQYNYQPKAKKSGEKSVGKYVVDLIVGGFRTITGYVAKENPDEYQVNTPVATIGVRGTEFSIVYKDGKAYMKQYKGKPCITSGKADKNNPNSTLCLDSKTKYGVVEDANSDPVPLTTQPDTFSVDVEVVPVSFVDSGTGLGGPGQGSGFCIQ